MEKSAKLVEKKSAPITKSGLSFLLAFNCAAVHKVSVQRHLVSQSVLKPLAQVSKESPAIWITEETRCISHILCRRSEPGERYLNA